MENPEPDFAIRLAAAQALSRLSDRFQGAIPWSALAPGFRFQNRQIRFASKAIGIFKPRDTEAVLSIRTSIPRGTRAPRYVDQVQEDTGDGLLAYDMEGKDPHNPRSKLLLEAFRAKTPLIYLQGIDPALYVAHFPVYVEDWDSGTGSTRIAFGLPFVDQAEMAVPSRDQQRYTRTLSKARVHQAQFREDVLGAYSKQCALTGIGSPELIVAAHIIPHAEGGKPVVQNGLCLSHLHHAAYDAHLIGIDPDFRIHVAQRLHMNESNAFVKGSFDDLSGRRIALPQNQIHYPRPEALEERFLQFKAMNS